MGPAMQKPMITQAAQRPAGGLCGTCSRAFHTKRLVSSGMSVMPVSRFDCLVASLYSYEATEQGTTATDRGGAVCAQRGRMATTTTVTPRGCQGCAQSQARFTPHLEQPLAGGHVQPPLTTLQSAAGRGAGLCPLRRGASSSGPSGVLPR